MEQNCLTVLGMDTGYTKVALPFSVITIRKICIKLRLKRINFCRSQKFGLFEMVYSLNVNRK